MRSNIPDFIPVTAKLLKNSFKTQKQRADVLNKSESKAPDFSNVTDRFITSLKESMDISKELSSQFKVLQADYNSGKINAVQYKHALSPLHDLLVNTEEKIEVPDFNTEEIAKELKRMGY
jgi:hypothetical protein